MKDIGSRLVMVRDYLHMTQGELGDAINVSRSNVGNWEGGRRRIPQKALNFLQERYGISLDWLISGKGDMIKEDCESFPEKAHYTVNHRMVQFIDYLNMSPSDFANYVSVAAPVIHNITKGRRSKPSFDLIRKIKSHYPNLSMEWLITGEGSMLLDDTDTPSLVTDSPVEYRQVNGTVIINIGMGQRKSVSVIIEPNENK